MSKYDDPTTSLRNLQQSRRAGAADSLDRQQNGDGSHSLSGNSKTQQQKLQDINIELRQAYVEYRVKWRKQLRWFFDVLTIVGFMNYTHY